MKKIILSSLILFSYLASTKDCIAQSPTLTATGNNPVIGDQFINNHSNYVNPGNAGPNQTWDFSSMTMSATENLDCVDPSSTPEGANFPNANIAFSSSTYAYYKTSATSFQFYGGVSGGGVVFPYSDPEDILHFPFNYNDSYIDTWATTFYNNGYTFYRTGADSVTADGYGTLITPAGTFNNAMRVHFVQNYQDSTDLGGFSYIITYRNDEYIWYLNGYHFGIAATYSFENSQTGTSQAGFYVSTANGMNDFNNLFSINIFPNPASDVIYIDTHNLNMNDEKYTLSIYNGLGVEVRNSEFHNFKSDININNLANGFYWIKISNEKGMAVAITKLMKE